ncbi:MAG: response regulator [Sulfurimonas sp.]|uniref:response regulator n=1 Tax=Sulfurimonas sp. TaxID=2022749 RepID=UPI0025DFCAE6|nr:response regulator [Sulfurimonas sp.]MCK9491211.1 response regulator [Sulfurimonas sp.]
MRVTPALIVDDSPMIVKIIKRSLLTNTIDGYHFADDSIYSASDGMEAFEVMGRAYDIKLIVTDINMPYLNGDEFIEILKDTGKLSNLEVVFVTSSSTHLILKSEIEDSILGIIYKPFRYESFAEEFKSLQKRKLLQNIELQNIKIEQVEKKEFIEKMCFLYLVDIGIDSVTDSLDLIIDESFSNAQITKEEYPELLYSILSIYLFETQVDHIVSHKRIKCILKRKENAPNVKKYHIGLMDDFKKELDYVNSKNLRPTEIVTALISNTFDTLSMTTSHVKKFPRVDNKLFAPHFEYTIKELTKIDCEFEDEKLLKLMSEFKEISEFSEFLYDFLKNKEVFKSIKAASLSRALGIEIKNRLSKILKITYALNKHYCSSLEFYIFKRVKSSSEIHRFFKKNMPKAIPCSSTFLHFKGKITTKELRDYAPYEMQKLVVISAELKTLEFFKITMGDTFKNWGVFCFAKSTILEAWLGSNKPNKIVIDYDYMGSGFKNGVEFLNLLYKKYPELKNEAVVNGIYFITKEQRQEEIKEYRDELKFANIAYPIAFKDVFEVLIYD